MRPRRRRAPAARRAAAAGRLDRARGQRQASRGAARRLARRPARMARGRRERPRGPAVGRGAAGAAGPRVTAHRPGVPPPAWPSRSSGAMDAAGAGIPRAERSVARAASVSHADLSEAPIADDLPGQLGHVEDASPRPRATRATRAPTRGRQANQRRRGGSPEAPPADDLGGRSGLGPGAGAAPRSRLGPVGAGVGALARAGDLEPEVDATSSTMSPDTRLTDVA